MSCVTPEYNKEYKRQYYLKNRDKILEQTRKRTEENKESISSRKKELHRKDPRKLLLSLAKKRAKTKGIEYNLELEDLTVPSACPVLGIQIEVGQGKIIDTSPSLDRIDNSKGYVKGNVQIISNLANRMKNSASPELLLKFAEWILKEKYEDCGLQQG